MRPVKLEMQAFESYLNKTIVDFTEFNDENLYIITGNTGAGKTTVFDAITFALYGESSGSLREADKLRTRFAVPEQQTYVKLEFEDKGEIYTIRRSPKYMRPSKKGAGKTTEEPASVELTLPDGKKMDNNKREKGKGRGPVDLKIEEIVGLDCKQFSKVVMIAQGEFKAILTAKTEERKLLLRHIFDTGKYASIQETLKNRNADLETKVKDLKKEKMFILNSISCDPDDALALSRLDSIRTEEKTSAETAAFIEELIEKDRAAERRKRGELEGLNKKNGEITSDLTKAEEQSRNENNLALYKEQLKAEQKIKEQAEAAFDAVKPEYAKCEGMASEIVRISSMLPDYAALTGLDAAIRAARKTSEETQADITGTTESQKILAEELKKLTEESESLKDAGADLEKLRNESRDLGTEIAEIDGLLGRAEAYGKSCLELNKKQADYDEELKGYNAFSKDYGEKRDLYFSSQASLLASRLAPGEPCPVCGSREHPAPHPAVEGLISEEEFKRLTDEERKMSDKISIDKSDLESDKKLLEENRKQLCSDAAKFTGEIEACDISSKASSVKEERKQRKTALDDEISKSEKKKARRDSLNDTLIPAKRKECQDAADRLNALQNKKTEADTTVSEKTSQREALAARLSEFGSEEKAKASIEELEKSKKDIAERYAKAEAALKEAQQRADTLNGQIKAAEEALKDRKEYDVEALTAEQYELSSKITALNDETGAVAGRIRANSDALTKLNDLRGRTDKAEAEQRMVNDLCRTANANVNGKKKLDLETYIQRGYFEKMISRANYHLKDMSDGVFEFDRPDADVSGKSGLDLEMICHDPSTGDYKLDVTSLSGGESFLASLSLALGMTEVIQAREGGIRIDTMFIDEGFGSLDSESLRLAYKGLSNLTDKGRSNRLIGLISHIPELEELIDNKIVVTKKNKISSLKVNP